MPRTMVVFTALYSLLIAGAYANAQTVRDDDDLPKSGSLSTSIVSGAAQATVPDPFGSVDFSGTKSAPITGSVSRVDADTWRLRVFNNSRDGYTVNLDVIQKDLDGRQVKSDSYSYNLKPGGSAEREIQSAPSAMEADLNLRSYKRHKK